MSAQTAAGVATFVAALAAVGCHTTAVVDPKGSASPLPDSALPSLPDATPAQAVTLSLFTPDDGTRRRFASGLTLSRVDLDGGAVTPVTLGLGSASPDGQEMTARPVTPGHYRAHVSVTDCAKGSPPDGCKATGAPKPTDVEFDVPAAGDVEVTVP